MASRSFRLNTIAAAFPLISTYFGRSTLARGAEDSNYIVTNAYTGAQADRDLGIPMPMYMHNVMPTTPGLKSVGYEEIAAPTPGYLFDSCFPILTNNNSRYLYSPCRGANALFDLGLKSWRPTEFINDIHAPVTKAHLHKQTYICYEHLGIFKFNEVSGLFEEVLIKGLDKTFIKGITSTNNYLIAYSQDAIYWSSVLDNTDFVPSLSTGAGSQIPIELKGQIVLCLELDSGFAIYTTGNIVFAAFANNIRFPFQFKEISNSGGLASADHVSQDTNSNNQYAWTTKGLQVISKSEAQGLFSEITDFLSSHVLEDYIGQTGKIANSNVSSVWAAESQTWSDYPLGPNNLVQFRYDAPLNIKVSYICGRWAVFSYGTGNEYQWALVYDTQLKRWGKLKITHVDCFELSLAAQDLVTTETNHRFCFLQRSGAIQRLALEDSAICNDSVLIFGKLQHTRGRVTTLDSFEIENGYPGEMNLTVLTSLDGKNWLPDLLPLPQIITKNLTRWLLRTTGVNHSFKITGTFNIVSMQGTCTVGGFR